MARRRAFIQAVLGGISALALALGGATAAVAVVPTGSITGVVTSEADGSPLEGITVHAVNDNGQDEADTVTDETGAYTLEGLVDGDWVVRFSATDGSVTPEYWNDVVEQWSAERIRVTDGAAISGIDAALASAPTGSISGVVTRDDDGTPLAGVEVSTGGEGTPWVVAYTDESGAYTLTGLAPGEYLVSFFAAGTNLKREYWKNAESWDAGTLVSVGDGTAITGIDAALAAGGAIAGTVTRAADASPIEGMTVNALDRGEIMGTAQTNGDGEYRIDGLSSGAYVVQFVSPDHEQIATEFWQNSYSYSAATPVTVSDMQTASDIDAALEAVGHIEGTVTKDGGGIVAASVWVLAANGDDFFAGAELASDGTYSVAVPPGEYLVQFASYDATYSDEYWEDAHVAQDAKTVVIASDQRVTGIDARMDRAGVLSGTVSIESPAVRAIVVEAWQGSRLIGSTRADLPTGQYSLSLPPGAYVLKASAMLLDDPTITAAPQFYDGVSTAAEATPVSAVVGSPVTGIDFTLVAVHGQPQPKPALTLSAGSIRAGADLSVSGTGFAPGAQLSFELHSDPIKLGTLTADAGGALAGTFRIPAGTPAGTHTLVALDAQSAVLASITVRVNAASGGASSGALATTGGDLPSFAIAMGLGLLLAGGLLVQRRRASLIRRR